ncbi:DUF885 domain-containing protein [Lentzea flava]|uniref:DUF885 domain-containing protein n=1 Tax=Lentzea flava TaxID=103732 RepID=A0ABQ2UXU8_9PSEU|nr:DUF885 domain-containing protein [Lentzea flava]MCP2200779.1 Uncharacterized conserved protein, DUF885 familyt [Lentzea flava]GGU55521.1 hypothetical protein GCM10010178_55010 [Lentzea flava]
MSVADEMFQAFMDASPMSATMFGLPGWDDRVEDLSVEGEQALRARITDILRRAEASDSDPVTLAVIRHQGQSMITRIDARLIEHTVATGLSAPVNGLLMIASQLDVSQRLDKFARYIGQAGERVRNSDRRPLRRHLEAGKTRLDRFLAAPAQEWEGSYSGEIRSAVAGFREVLASIEDGRGDDQPGLCWLPEGEQNYANLVRNYTTTSYSPAELHQLGLDLIARLRDEYAEIGSRLWGTGDVQEIFRRLRTELLWDNEEEMVANAVEAIARAEAEAPNWFGRMPKVGCQVRAVDEAERETSPIAFYLPAPLDGSRPGTYWLNPLGATERSRTLSEATAFHEAVPGHHYQLSIAAETDMHNIRRFAFIEAYLEGWGLYTERLADEMGLYSSDEQRLGMLGLDAMRAGRLVVDTGLHAFGWTRQQAVDYLRENTVMPEPEITSEIDRYIEVPGQALAYMVGRLEIQRVRAEAEEKLGDRFDVRAFHDLVVGSGAVPLPVLNDLVSAWTAAA